MIHIYNETFEKTDEWFKSVSSKAVSLVNRFGTKKK